MKSFVTLLHIPRLVAAFALGIVALIAAFPLAAPAEATGPTTLGRTPWQVIPIADYISGVPDYGSHGHISYYSHLASYPAPNHVNWADCGPSSPLRESPYAAPAPLCPDPATIGMVVGSRLPGCMTYVDFTLFQTFVDIPLGTTLSTFTIAMSGMDDGARITIFNSAYPGGLVVPGSYVYLGGSGTSNLAPYVVVGETNRVVITQMDDCAVGNNLQSAVVVLNGEVIPPVPAAPTVVSPADGSLVSVNGYTVSGTGTPGAYANLLINGLPNGQIALVEPDGTWSIPGVLWPFPPPPLGGYDISATQSATWGGTPGPESNVVHVTNYPPPPVILTPLSGLLVEPGGFAVSGTGVPGLEVHIQFDGLFNAQFTTVAPDGTWSFASVFGYEFLPGPTTMLTAVQRLGFGELDSAPSNAVELVIAVECGPGTYSGTGYSPCTPAYPGTYVDTAGATEATLCAPGTYQPDAGQTECIPAPPGSYVDTAGATEATLCAPGTYQPDAGQTECIPAPPGSYVDTVGATEATLCAPGTYQPDAGQTECIPAPPGSYVDTVGATEATLCAPGTYQPDAGQTECIPAPPGSYVDTVGATEATLCAPGTYQPDAGQTECIPAPPGSYVDTVGATEATLCAPGTYQPDAGQTECIPAPPGSYVDTAGATEATLCAPGTYQPDAGQTECLVAPVDTYVDTSGAIEVTACPPGTWTDGLVGQTGCTSHYEFPVGGVFVIGNHAIQTTGASVTFWSAQWGSSNPTSSAAPNGVASFKGFGQSAGVPACGGQWTASTGNSGKPPALVPDYMAVAVTSTITRQGSRLAGNIETILIVKTDPGYGAAPGHRGTGTVVGVLCGG